MVTLRSLKRFQRQFVYPWRFLLATIAVVWTADKVRRVYSSPAPSRVSHSQAFALTKARSQQCQGGWVLPEIDPAMQDYVERITAAWHKDLPTLLRKLYNNASEMKHMAGPVSEPAGHNRFDVIMPAVEKACRYLTRVGSDGDGGKLICGLDRIPHSADNPCIVYSIGSNNQWDFETDIVRSTTCSVFTFDCTVDGLVPADIRDRVAFHKICLGTNNVGAEADSGTSFLSLKQIMAVLGHDHITLLKMDIEGYEYDVFEEILSETDVHLPEQISFELHYETQMQGLDWHGRQRTAGEMALFSQLLYEAGYRVVSREDNPQCDHCSEYTVVRFQCPSNGH